VVTPETNTRDHIEDSLLLAYLRRQKLDDDLSLRISRHIEIERCPRCRRKLSQLVQVSATLDVLGQMPSYQHYPEMSMADTYTHVQRAANKRTPVQALLHRINNRQRPRKSAVRLVSLPVAFGLAILFTVVMLVFANLIGQSWIPLSGGGVIRHTLGSSAVEVPSHPTDLALTATERAIANATAALTPTATPITEPYIEVCSALNNIARWRLVICGHNFKAGYKVTLVAFGKTVTRLPNLSVNKQGYFQVGWNIDNCGNLPTIIIAYEYEKANAKSIYAGLQNIAFGDCPLPAHRVGPSGV
jgi:hypothetical protein